MRVTKKDASAAYCRMVKAAVDADVPVVGWSFHQGNSSYSIAWALHTAGAPIPWAQVRWATAREATIALDAMTAAFELIARDR